MHTRAVVCPRCRPAYEDALAHNQPGRAEYIHTRCEQRRHSTDQPADQEI